MKITTRIILGYGLFIAILMGLAIYQVFTIRRMQAINETLQESNFRNAQTSLQALRYLDLIEEYTRKSFAVGDPDYVNQLKEFQRDFETRLIQLQDSVASENERTEISRLGKFWNSLAFNLRQIQRDPPSAATAVPKNLQDDIDRLRAQTHSVYQSTLETMSAAVEKSRKTSDAAAWILGCSVFIALSISILVSFLIYRSISNPLHHLTEGTRAIAEGKFYYRLDTSRND